MIKSEPTLEHVDDEEMGGMKAKLNAHPPLRNSLLAALIAGIGFISFNLGLFPGETEISLFSVVILLGGYHWSREGIEELYEEGKVGIEILMRAATAGSVILGLWDESAFLVVLYGAAEGVEEYTYEKTRMSIRKLLDLVPEEWYHCYSGRNKTRVARCHRRTAEDEGGDVHADW